MNDIYSSLISSHNGISYSTVIIFGSFIFLLLTTFLGQNGRISEVLRKASFFSMFLLGIQAILGILTEFYAPGFADLSGGKTYFQHFKYGIIIGICAGMMAYVNFYLKKTPILTLQTVIVALLSALLFEYAYPWRIIFGE